MDANLEAELRRALDEGLRAHEWRAAPDGAERLDSLIRAAAARHDGAPGTRRSRERVVTDFDALLHAMIEVARAEGGGPLTSSDVDRVLVRACPLFPFC